MGACEPKNPGGVGTYGFLILDEKGNTIHEGYGIACEPGPGCTNNIAEYTGLVKALEWLVGNGYSALGL
ncbi:hypothetical protein [Vulcanisaeta distributa]|uniref:hypothetical protein n=1 Tax=Vulcanisaeta distributa TaxID=164451 RepID=UPI000B00DADA|nr:hypothetical protein [Vulcanisaeta distributa]